MQVCMHACTLVNDQSGDALMGRGSDEVPGCWRPVLKNHLPRMPPVHVRPPLHPQQVGCMLCQLVQKSGIQAIEAQAQRFNSVGCVSHTSKLCTRKQPHIPDMPHQGNAVGRQQQLLTDGVVHQGTVALCEESGWK